MGSFLVFHHYSFVSVWKPDYQPSPSLESVVEKVTPHLEFAISSVNTLAAENPIRNVPTVLKGKVCYHFSLGIRQRFSFQKQSSR